MTLLSEPPPHQGRHPRRGAGYPASRCGRASRAYARHGPRLYAAQRKASDLPRLLLRAQGPAGMPKKQVAVIGASVLLFGVVFGGAFMVAHQPRDGRPGDRVTKRRAGQTPPDRAEPRCSPAIAGSDATAEQLPGRETAVVALHAPGQQRATTSRHRAPSVAEGPFRASTRHDHRLSRRGEARPRARWGARATRAAIESDEGSPSGMSSSASSSAKPVSAAAVADLLERRRGRPRTPAPKPPQARRRRRGPSSAASSSWSSRPTSSIAAGQRLGRLDLDPPVALEPRGGRDQLADDHVLLEAVEAVDLALERRVGEHLRRLLEGGRREERVGVQRGLGDAEDDLLGLRRLAARRRSRPR